MMRVIVLALGALTTQAAWAADINKKIIAEVDPIAPGSAAYEEATNDVTTSKFGAGVDFNVGGVISTGPELWTGNFVMKGANEEGATYRREDMFPGERHKIDATRLRWTVTRWELPSSMRGWYVKAGYSYLRVNSRANRYTEASDGNDAVPVNFFTEDPGDETDLITDIRHGATGGFGNRWLLWNQSLSLSLGASFTATFKRTVSVDSKDPMARRDYDAMIADLPDTKMSLRPTPEVNLGMGYAW
jgi:hypothetical protein